MKKIFHTVLVVLIFILITACGSNGGEYQTPFIEMFSAGRADAHFLQSGRGAYMIDTGSPDSARAVADRLHTLGITDLDIIITHAHKDHYGGLSTIQDEFNVGKVYFTLPSKQMCMDTPLQCDWEYLSGLQGLITVHDGQVIVDDQGLRVTVVSTVTTGPTINTGGTILSVYLGGIKIDKGYKVLYMADANESLTEHVRQIAGHHDVYKVPHHGIYNFGGTALPESIDAYVALIPNTLKGWEGEKLIRAREYFNTGWDTYVSGRDGVVRLTVERGGLNITTSK